MTTKVQDAPSVVEGTAEEIPSTDLVVPDNEQGTVFRVLDRHDEDLIEAEIKGELITTMAYEFEVGGRKVRGLSIAGVNGAVRDMNARGMARIACPPTPAPRFEEITDEDGDAAWECTVYATDELVGGGAWGIASQKKVQTLRSGTTRGDVFSRRKALSKAQRNAKASLIPERLKAEIVAALTSGQVQRVISRAESDHAGALPAAATGPEADALDATCLGLMDEMGMRPAKVKALMDATRTVEQKEALRDRLIDIRDRRARGAPAR